MKRRQSSEGISFYTDLKKKKKLLKVLGLCACMHIDPEFNVIATVNSSVFTQT